MYSLISHAYDQNETVRMTISVSLHDIGLQQPELVLSTCMAFIKKNTSKLDQGHRVQVLKTMVTVLEAGRDKVRCFLANCTCANRVACARAGFQGSR